MKKLFAIMLLSLGLIGSASAQQKCPIEIKRTDSHSYASTSDDPWGSALKIEFVNHASLNMTAVKFGVYFANTMGEHEKSMYYYTDNEILKPEKLRKSSWPDGVYTQGDFSMKALAWVERAGFADGSVWQDDGSKSCGLVGQLAVSKPYQPTPPSAPQASAPTAQVEELKANSEAAKSSPAAAASMAIAGKEFTPQELAELVKQGKASRCAVLTAPAGAEVYIDGNKAGITPVAFVLIQRDFPRVITVKMDGYKSVEKQVTPDGKVIPIAVQLEKASK